jgi:hypothetical protein
MPFSFFISHRNKLLSQPFPDTWLNIISSNFWQYSHLNDTEKQSIRKIARVLVAEKNWEGCQGIAITEEIQVTIASIAALPLIGIEHNYYSNAESVLVYPYDYLATEVRPGPAYTVNERPTIRAGETTNYGPVILSWPDALAAGRRPGLPTNVTIHEFSHKLDWANGAIDGVPGMDSQEECDRWEKVMGQAYADHCKAVEVGTPTLINPYGATSPPEFFAVVAECFFQIPRHLQHYHPDLYNLYRDYYKQDPAKWIG